MHTSTKRSVPWSSRLSKFYSAFTSSSDQWELSSHKIQSRLTLSSRGHYSRKTEVREIGKLEMESYRNEQNHWYASQGAKTVKSLAVSTTLA